MSLPLGVGPAAEAAAGGLRTSREHEYTLGASSRPVPAYPPAVKKIVVIPTYNEVENLPHVVGAVLAADPELEILITDDASPDGTGRLAARMAEQEPRLHVLHRPRKEGLGPAYKAGMGRALEMGADLVVQMDADLSHPASALPRFFELAREHDVVLGSRYCAGVTVMHWPMDRLIISYYGNRYARLVLGRIPIDDLSSGFKCYRRQALFDLGLSRVRSNGYSFQIEMVYRALQAGLSVVEVPIVFTERTRGESKLNLKIAFEALLVVWILRLQAALGRLVEVPAAERRRRKRAARTHRAAGSDAGEGSGAGTRAEGGSPPT